MTERELFDDVGEKFELKKRRFEAARQVRDFLTSFQENQEIEPTTKLPYNEIARDVLENLQEGYLFFIVNPNLTSNKPRLSLRTGLIKASRPPNMRREFSSDYGFQSIDDFLEYQAQVNAMKIAFNFVGLEIAVADQDLHWDDPKIISQMVAIYRAHHATPYALNPWEISTTEDDLKRGYCVIDRLDANSTSWHLADPHFGPFPKLD